MVILVSLVTGTNAQNAVMIPGKLYKTWITFNGEKGKLKGVLYDTRDSSILVSDSYNKTNYMDGKYNLKKVEVSKINDITVRRQNAIGRGVLFGGLGGVAIGAVIGLTAENTATDERANAGFKATGAIFTSIFMGACGAAIGAVFGTICTKVHLHGNQKQYLRNRPRLSQRSLVSDAYRDGAGEPAFLRLRDTVVDVDGNVYHTVALGAMVFMAENLKAGHFRNGMEIQPVKDSSGWRTATGPAWCNYNNDSATGLQYGKLYNGYAVSDTSGLCPAGWHIPSYDEWTSLVMCLGGSENAGGFMKEAGTAHWNPPNKTALTENTFALPGGNRGSSGTFSQPGRICQWWASVDKVTGNNKGLSLTNESVAVKTINPEKSSGLSVRCMRD